MNAYNLKLKTINFYFFLSKKDSKYDVTITLELERRYYLNDHAKSLQKITALFMSHVNTCLLKFKIVKISRYKLLLDVRITRQ